MGSVGGDTPAVELQDLGSRWRGRHEDKRGGEECVWIRGQGSEIHRQRSGTSPGPIHRLWAHKTTKADEEEKGWR